MGSIKEINKPYKTVVKQLMSVLDNHTFERVDNIDILDISDTDIYVVGQGKRCFIINSPLDIGISIEGHKIPVQSFTNKNRNTDDMKIMAEKIRSFLPDSNDIYEDMIRSIETIKITSLFFSTTSKISSFFMLLHYKW